MLPNFLPQYFGPLWLTGEEVGLETLLGDGVVRLELNPHVVVLGGDDLGCLRSTEFPMKLWVWSQPTAHLHVIIFTHLMVDTRRFYLLQRTKSWPVKLARFLRKHSYITYRQKKHHSHWLTSFPSVSNTSNTRVIRYWVGATSCHTQFLLGGYSLGQPGVVREPFSFVMNPPQAAAGGRVHWF